MAAETWCPHALKHFPFGLYSKGFPCGSDGKESACNVGDLGYPWVWKSPWRREKLPPPVILAWRIPWTEDPGQRATVHGVAKSKTGLSNFHFPL